jgi:hypothetical protein
LLLENKAEERAEAEKRRVEEERQAAENARKAEEEVRQAAEVSAIPVSLLLVSDFFEARPFLNYSFSII